MKRSLAIILAAIFVLMSFTACSVEDIIGGLFGPKLSINVPDEVLQAELGSYDLPKFNVVDEDNLIKAGYEVIVKKVVDPNGNDVKVAYNKINALVPGIYTITYGVAEGKIADAELKVEFADRTAPTLDMKDDALPKYYIKDMSYTLPTYSLSGDPDLEACYAKVYYLATSESEKVEVEVLDGRFTVEHNTGIYQILIHVEDAAGNVKEYTFNVEATGPSEVVEGKVLYSDEPFGASQLEFLWNVWSMEYSTEKAWGDEAGSIKVTAPGGATDYLILSKLIQRDVSEYDELIIRIYNNNDYPVYTGYPWFGDTLLQPHTWTEIVWSLSDLDVYGSHPAVAALKPTSKNLENFALRFWDDFATNTVTAGSEFYISAMYAKKQEVTGPSEIKDDVIMYFDEPWGQYQGGPARASVYKQEYTTEVRFGEEAGSTKVTLQRDHDATSYTLKNPSITDITKYEYVEFYVFNPNTAEMYVNINGFSVTCKPGEWTQVRFNVADMEGNITDLNGFKVKLDNITNWSIWMGTEKFGIGECFYISQMRGVGKSEAVDPEVGVEVDDLVSNLNIPTKVYQDAATTEYVTDVKFGDEEGSLKAVLGVTGEIYITLRNFQLQNVASYDYIVFRVYNPTDHDITAGLCWWADTVCKAGEWTEIQLPIDAFAVGKIDDLYTGLDILPANISGLTLRVLGGQQVGDELYFSSIYAHKTEKVFGVKGDVADLGTLTTQEGKEGNYLQRGTTNGWSAMWSRSDEIAEFGHNFDMLTINGKYNNPEGYNGKVMSPYYNGTISKISFGYGYANTEEGNISLTVNIVMGGKVVASKEINDTGVEKYQNMEFVWELDEPIEGRFMIEILNNSPTKKEDGNKDRISIWNIQWEGPADPVEVDDLVSNLNIPTKVYQDAATTEYVTDVKFGEEEGSLKVVAGVTGEIYVTLRNFQLQNVASYDYIVFRVYNPTDHDITAGLCWWADTVCKAGEWTEIQLPIDAFAVGKIDDLYTGLDILPSNISGLTLRVLGGQQVGDALYFSSIYAHKTEKVFGVTGDVADLGTLTTQEGKEGNYLQRGTTNGWSAMWSRSDEVAEFGHSFDMVTINGKYNNAEGYNGKVMSPYYNGTISKISFGYGYAYTEDGNISLTVNIVMDGKVVASKRIDDTGVEKYQNMEFVWELDEPIEGRFMIEILNNCPTKLETGNKDRIAIWNIRWGDAVGEETPAPEHACESVCAECGKCLDAACTEAACAEKCAGHEVAPEPESNETLVSKLDGNLNPFQGSSTVAYVTDVKYGEEAGSLKITANATGEHYVSILAPEIKDVSEYQYIVFRVYTDKDITAGSLWCADTACKAGEWTEIRIPVSYFAEGKVTDFGKALPATDITGICVRIFAGLEVGESVYVSHWYAVK